MKISRETSKIALSSCRVSHNTRRKSAASAFPIMLEPSSRDKERPSLGHGDHTSMHRDECISPGISLAHPRTGLSETCLQQLADVGAFATSNGVSDGAALSQSALRGMDGIPHSWAVNMMFQTFGVTALTKFTDEKMQVLFDQICLERTMRWNNVAHMELLQDIRDMAEVMLTNCLVPLDEILKNSYEVQNKPIFMWSETYLRRCFNVSEIYWISCEDIFTRTNEIIYGISDITHGSKLCLPSLQPNASILPVFHMVFQLAKILFTIREKRRVQQM